MKLDGYCLCSPTKVRKQHWIGGLFEPNTLSPLFYIQRPTWIEDDEKWLEIVESIQINLPKGFEI